MRELIAALGHDIKASGKNWIARCPVHNDKDFAMSIKEGNDGSVLAICHACGANGLDLYKTLGLNLDELFGGRKLEKNNYIPSNIKAHYDLDKMVIAINLSDIEAGRVITLADKRRVKLAEARIAGIESKFDM